MSFTHALGMAKAIKLQIYVARRANIYFHLADNTNDNIFILLNKTLTRTEFADAVFHFYLHQFNIKLRLLRCCCSYRKLWFACLKPSPFPYIRVDASWTTFPM